MLCVGIDWATDHHTVALLDGPGRVLATITIANSMEGYLHLLDVIRRYAAKLQTQEVLFAVENRNLRLVDFLLANGFTGYYVDPNRMTGYRLRYKSSGAKDDDQDAFILGDVLCRDRDQLPVIEPDSELVQRLKLLLADRESLVQDKTAASNRLTACLREYYPEALELFDDVAGKTALAFLKAYPSFPSTQTLDGDTLKAFLVQHHSYRKLQLLRMLKVITQHPISVPPVIVQVKQRLALHLVEQLRILEAAIATYNQEIEALCRGNPEIERFGSLPGAGPILSSGLFTLFGEDRNRFSDASEVQSYIGTAPKTVQSGNYRGVCFRFSCRRDYRAVANQLAFCSRRSSEWARNYYRGKRREGKSHYHALRCLANLLIKIAFAVWRDRTTYSEELHLAQLARHEMRNRNQLNPDQA